MAKHSFEIQNEAALLEKLHEEYSDFQQDPSSSRHAINCAMTAWHLIEWVWEDNKLALSQKYSDMPASRRDLKANCPELEVMECIANGSKHVKPRSNKVQSTELHKGAFSRGFSAGFNIEYLEVLLGDGTRVSFDSQIEKVVEFWDNYFQNTLRKKP